MNLKHIGILIKDRRKSRGIVQDDLAEIAGISPRTLRDIESGTGNPELKSLLSILEVLGLEMTVKVK